MCLDVSDAGSKPPIRVFSCHGTQGNQLWRYELVSIRVFSIMVPRVIKMAWYPHPELYFIAVNLWSQRMNFKQLHRE